jgi:hypothetical protein
MYNPFRGFVIAFRALVVISPSSDLVMAVPQIASTAYRVSVQLLRLRALFSMR